MIETNDELGSVSEAVVIDSARITAPDQDEVRRITLRIDDPAFHYMVGQSIGVVVPGPHPMGNRYHIRRYSIANGHEHDAHKATELELLVRRCFTIDEVSGERYPGIASNHLCDAEKGQTITITGPFRSPFIVPRDDRANLLMIGTGTGIAPFRAFIQEIYRNHGAWRGQVRLYYGARSGMDLLYGNDEQGDLTQYYDNPSFEAFRALLGRHNATEGESLQATLDDHGKAIWSLMQDSNTHVYLAGLKKISAVFDRGMAELAGGEAAWSRRKEALIADGRWAELVYS